MVTSDVNQELERRVQDRTALLKLLQNIAFTANLADRLEEAVAYALMRICRHFNWPFGCAYLSAPDTGALAAIDAFYYEEPRRFEELRRDVMRQSLPRGRGVAGQVAAAGKPVCGSLSDLDDPGLAQAAGKSGLQAAAGFPLLVENRVVAVLVFLVDRPLLLDSRSLDAMAAIGAQLGGLIERKQAEDQLRASEERFHAVFQNAAIGMALMEVGYGAKFLRTNRAFNRMLGYDAYALNHSSLVDICDPQDLEQAFSLYHELLEGARSCFQVETRMRAREGRTVWGRLMVSLIGGEHGSPAGTVLLVEDITDRKRAEEQLRRISLSLDHAREGIAHVGRDGRYLAANRAYAEILGVTAEELIGRSWENTLGATSLAKARAAWKEALSRGKADFSGTSRSASGQAQQYHAVLYRSADESLSGHYCFLEDVTERKRLEKEIVDVAVDRQRRIGQELQEGLIQQLTGIRMLARSLAQHVEKSKGPEAPLAGDFLRLLADAQAQAKAVIKGLRPVEVDANGLMASLQDLTVATAQRFGISCEFEAEGEVPVEDNNTATQLFYIAQEAITDAVKRNQEACLVIRLAVRHGKLALSVSDRSGGIPGRVPDYSGMSARIMQYRASIIGANLEICSADGGGAAVVCTL
jgi:PAS domain S-box-containing protein